MATPQKPTSDKGGMAPSYNPETPQKVDRSHHGLSLHMPQKLPGNKPAPPFSRLPLSPKLDSVETFGSPASVLPRRSRGLDFSRACTNLHHSTLAESSPDSSPVVGARGVLIPQRRGTGGLSMVGSPGNVHYNTGNSGFGQNERSVMSGSISSVNMLDSDESSSTDDDDDESINAFERDAILTTPQRGGNGPNGLSTPLAPNPMQSPGGGWMNNFSAAKSSLLSFQRGRFRIGRSKHNSNSASGHGSKHTPSSRDSPLMKSLDASSANHFPKIAPKINTNSVLGGFGESQNEAHLSDVSDDGEGRRRVSSPSSGSLAGGSNSESGRKGVIRRAVTRRGNLLPKTKNFARIRAALFEEGAPIESEAKREADVIKQVRENDNPDPPLSPTLLSSAILSVPREAGSNADAPDTASSAAIRPSTSFRRQVSQNSGGIEFWNSFDNRYRTPPPSGAGDSMMSTPSGNGSLAQAEDNGADRGQKKGEVLPNANKRRRPDDFDLASFKRRAVSPGTSTQSSPSQSHPPSTLENARSKAIHIPGSHSSEGATAAGSHSGHIKRVGLQGMKETNDGLMNMSID